MSNDLPQNGQNGAKYDKTYLSTAPECTKYKMQMQNKKKYIKIFKLKSQCNKL